VPRALRDLTYLGVTRSSIQQLLVNGRPLPGLPIQGMTLTPKLRAAVGS